MMEEKQRKVDFNSALLLAQEIVNLRVRANSYYLVGNIPKYYAVLKTMKLSSIANIPQADREALENIELEIRKPFHRMIISVRGFNNSEKYGVALSEAGILAEKYDIKLMDILQKIGFLMGEKADISKFGNIEFIDEEEK